MAMQRVAAILLTSLLAGRAVAGQQRDSLPRDTARKLVPVTVTETRAAATVGGASAVVVKVSEVRSSPAPVLEQALRESPFVHVRQNSRGEMELSIRGSDSRQAAVLMDGVPITLGWDHRTDPSLVPLTGAQTLVIVRGLSSVLNGPNTLGGTIEVSHDDAFGRLGAGRLWGGAGVDENAAYVASIGGGRDVANAPGGTLSLRAGLSHSAREGFTLPADARDTTAVDGLRTNSDVRESDAFGGVQWRGARGRSLGLLVSSFAAERGVPPEEHLVAPRLWRYPSNTRTLATLAASAGSFTTPYGHGTLDAGAAYQAGRLRILSYDDRTYRTVTGEETGDERTWTGRARFTHTLPAGASLRAAATVATVDYLETLAGPAVSEYGQRLWSGGAEVDVPLGGSGTTLSGGAVHDRVSTPETGGRTAGTESFAAPGWRLGLTHDVATRTRLHASVSQRSRFPSLRELYSGALNRFMPNPALRPERLLGLEAGVTVDRPLGGIPDATLQVVAFRHDLDDAIVRITLPPPDRRFQRINRDRILSHGIELLGGLAFSENHARALTLTGDATLQRISIRDASSGAIRHAENNPEIRGMLEAGVPLPASLRGFANARYTGVQYCLNADTGGEMRLAARTEANAALERRFPMANRGALRSLRAVLALDNATNAAIYDQCGLPQPGRTLRFMLSFQ